MAKKSIKVCPNCGSAELEWIGGGANAVFDFTGASGLSGLLHCANCGRNILPLEFPSEKARKRFAASLKKHRIAAPEEEKAPETAPSPAQAKGIDLSRGYAATVIGTGCAVSAMAFLLIFLATGNLACGLLPAFAFALLAAYLFLTGKQG